MKLIIVLLVLMLSFCTVFSQGIPEENRIHVGDIPFDGATDDASFEICNEMNVLPYNTRYGMYIEGERYGVLQYFREKYTIEPINGQTGYITIRFLVNCRGETDRFRIYEMDNNMKETTFEPIISQTLLQLTKKLKGWKIQFPDKLLHTGGLPVNYVSEHPQLYDYYQYLLFKIKDGQIETILP